MNYEGHSEDKAKIISSLGGARGMIDSGVPSIAFLIYYDITKHVSQAAVVAIALSLALTVIRLIRRETLQHALSGVFIVLVCVFISHRTGKAKDFYLPGLIINTAYACAYAITNIAGWPILGVLLGPILGENLAWRKVPARKAAYIRAGWLWVGLFISRLLIQYPLYRANQLNLLGTALVVLGYPLFFLTAWGTWRILAKVPSVKLDETEIDEIEKD